MKAGVFIVNERGLAFSTPFPNCDKADSYDVNEENMTISFFSEEYQLIQLSDCEYKNPETNLPFEYCFDCVKYGRLVMRLYVVLQK